MDDLPVASVQIDQCVEQLIGPGNHGAPRKRARLLGNNLSEVSAGDELHYQKCPVAFREIVTDARQRWMMELRQQTRLLLKLSPETFVNRKGFLQSNRRIQSQIDRFINGAHPAFTQLPDDPVTVRQNGAGRQHRRVPAQVNRRVWQQSFFHYGDSEAWIIN